MSKKKESKNLTTNGNGKKPETPAVEYLPKDFEADESPTARAFMKAVRITHRRLYPELYEKTEKRA